VVWRLEGKFLLTIPSRRCEAIHRFRENVRYAFSLSLTLAEVFVARNDKLKHIGHSHGIGGLFLGDPPAVQVNHAVGPLRREGTMRNDERRHILQVTIKPVQ
jgi:hypothetical protein